MSDSKIICPSCGAENKYGGKCEFCGATLDSGDSASVYKTLLGDAVFKYRRQVAIIVSC